MTAAPNDAFQRPRKSNRRADDEQLHGQVRRPEADGAELSEAVAEQDLDGAEERRGGHTQPEDEASHGPVRLRVARPAAADRVRAVRDARHETDLCANRPVSRSTKEPSN